MEGPQETSWGGGGGLNWGLWKSLGSRGEGGEQCGCSEDVADGGKPTWWHRCTAIVGGLWEAAEGGRGKILGGVWSVCACVCVSVREQGEADTDL